MYGEKLHSYGVTAKCGGAKAPLAPPIPPPMLWRVQVCRWVENFKLGQSPTVILTKAKPFNYSINLSIIPCQTLKHRWWR